PPPGERPPAPARRLLPVRLDRPRGRSRRGRRPAAGAGGGPRLGPGQRPAAVGPLLPRARTEGAPLGARAAARDSPRGGHVLRVRLPAALALLRPRAAGAAAGAAAGGGAGEAPLRHPDALLADGRAPRPAGPQPGEA